MKGSIRVWTGQSLLSLLCIADDKSRWANITADVNGIAIRISMAYCYSIPLIKRTMPCMPLRLILSSRRSFGARLHFVIALQNYGDMNVKKMIKIKLLIINRS